MSVGDLPEMHVAAAVLARARLIGSIGWAVIFTAFVSWEAVGLMVGHGWPTLSHVTRAVTRSPVGRWVLFGAWLWLGWNLFIRGWQFFLRGPLAEGPRPGRAGSGVRETLAEFLVLGATLSLAVAGMTRHGGRDAEQPFARRPVGLGALLLGILLVRRAAMWSWSASSACLCWWPEAIHRICCGARPQAARSWPSVWSLPDSWSCRWWTRGSLASAAGARLRLADCPHARPPRSASTRSRPVRRRAW